MMVFLEQPLALLVSANNKLQKFTNKKVPFFITIKIFILPFFACNIIRRQKVYLVYAQGSRQKVYFLRQLAAFCTLKLTLQFTKYLALAIIEFLPSLSDVPWGVGRPGNWADWTAWGKPILTDRQSIPCDNKPFVCPYKINPLSNRSLVISITSGPLKIMFYVDLINREGILSKFRLPSSCSLNITYFIVEIVR